MGQNSMSTVHWLGLRCRHSAKQMTTTSVSISQSRHASTSPATFRIPSSTPRPFALSSPSLLRSYNHNSSSPNPIPSSFFTPSLCRIRSFTTLIPLIPAASFSTTPLRLGSIPPSTTTALTWNDFFALRTSQRRYSLLSSVLAAVGTTVGGLTVLTTTPLPDTLASASSLDPFLTSGLCTVFCFALGWLIGPTFGQALWRLVHRRAVGAYVNKERDFFARVKKFRVDPQGASTTNPVPDYYGEKVGSVRGYRQWLKDQKAFNRKKSGSVLK